MKDRGCFGIDFRSVEPVQQRQPRHLAMLIKPLKLNNEYLSQHLIQKNEVDQTLVKEFKYNNNWVRLSRGLSNFRVTEEMTKKRVPVVKPPKVKVVKQKAETFEGLLLKINSMTDNILVQAASPNSNQPQQTNGQQHNQYQEAQSKITKSKGKQLVHDQSQQVNPLDNSQPSLSQLDPKDIINIHIDTSSNNYANGGSQGRKKQRSSKDVNVRVKLLNKQINAHKDRLINNRSQLNKPNQRMLNTMVDYSEAKEISSLGFEHNQKYYTPSQQPVRGRLQSAMQQHRKALIFNANHDASNSSYSSLYRKFVPPIIKNRQSFNSENPNRPKTQIERLQDNLKGVNRNFTQLDQSVKFEQSNGGIQSMMLVEDCDINNLTINYGQYEISKAEQNNQSIFNQSQKRLLYTQSNCSGASSIKHIENINATFKQPGHSKFLNQMELKILVEKRKNQEQIQSSHTTGTVQYEKSPLIHYEMNPSQVKDEDTLNIQTVTSFQSQRNTIPDIVNSKEQVNSPQSANKHPRSQIRLNLDQKQAHTYSNTPKKANFKTHNLDVPRVQEKAQKPIYNKVVHIKNLRDNILEATFDGYLDDVKVLTLLKKQFEQGGQANQKDVAKVDEASAQLYTIQLFYSINEKLRKQQYENEAIKQQTMA